MKKPHHTAPRFHKNYRFAPTKVISGEQMMQEILQYDAAIDDDTEEYEERNAREEKERRLSQQRKDKAMNKYKHWSEQ